MGNCSTSEVECRVRVTSEPFRTFGLSDLGPNATATHEVWLAGFLCPDAKCPRSSTGQHGHAAVGPRPRLMASPLGPTGPRGEATYDPERVRAARRPDRG